ncbi:MAG TPA: hypothetical protein VKX28_04215 [Xanthobacteraceae bacterium]|nr:hypothetical protein [Xanthobacteraceae bacterium]
MRKRTFLAEGYISPAKEREELDRRYHKIGISAVAAAVRYQGETKNTQTRDEDQLETESAA